MQKNQKVVSSTTTIDHRVEKWLNTLTVSFLTFSGKNRVGRDGGLDSGRQSEDEADGFDDHYFRRRPKSFCLPPHAPPHMASDPRRFMHPGMHLPPGPTPLPTTLYHQMDPNLQISMGSLIDDPQQQRNLAMVSSLLQEKMLSSVFKVRNLLGIKFFFLKQKHTQAQPSGVQFFFT